MAKCYFCAGAGCSECRKSMKSYYEPGAIAKAKPPSPNEVKPPVAARQSVVAQQIARSEKFVKELCDAAAAKPKEKLYGWVSQKSLRQSKGVVYRRPDGSEVLVSCVSRDPDHHGTYWTDCQCIGEVTDYVRQG